MKRRRFANNNETLTQSEAVTVHHKLNRKFQVVVVIPAIHVKVRDDESSHAYEIELFLT